LNDEIVHLKDELEHASIRAEQQTSENSVLEEKLGMKQLEIIELEEQLKISEYQLRQEQNLKEQIQQSEACLGQR
jgi:hypothetical protein